MEFKIKIMPDDTSVKFHKCDKIITAKVSDLAKEAKLGETVYRSVVMQITNNETGEAEFVPLYSWTEKRNDNGTQT